MQSLEHWLSLDLSSPGGSLSLHRKREGRLTELQQIVLDGPHRQSELMLPAVEQLLSDAGLEQNALSRLIVCSGPGSFTGLRIGYAFAKGFASVHRIPIETLSGSEARARHFFRESTEDAVTLVTTLTPRNSLWESFTRTGCERIATGSGPLETLRWPSYPVRCDERSPLATNGTPVLSCSAARLALGVFERQALHTQQSLEALIYLSPDYVGGERFTTAPR